MPLNYLDGLPKENLNISSRPSEVCKNHVMDISCACLIFRTLIVRQVMSGFGENIAHIQCLRLVSMFYLCRRVRSGSGVIVKNELFFPRKSDLCRGRLSNQTEPAQLSHAQAMRLQRSHQASIRGQLQGKVGKIIRIDCLVVYHVRAKKSIQTQIVSGIAVN